MIEITGYFIVGILGLFAHFLKRKIKGEQPEDIKDYFVKHPKTTILTLIFFIVAFGLMVNIGEVSFLNAFLSGYAVDSLFSKDPKKALNTFF